MSTRMHAAAVLAALAVFPGLVACESHAPASDCAARAAEQFRRGLALLEESRDGEHYRSAGFEAAMTELRQAAEAGDRDAQSLYGRTLFATLYASHAPITSEANEASERDRYVSALIALRSAALAGDEAARRFLPGLAADPPDPSAPPLDSLPKAWIDEAIDGARIPSPDCGRGDP